MKILLVGCNGKMGQQMQKVLEKHSVEFLGIDKENRKLSENFDADVVLDFSTASTLQDNLTLAASKHIPIVIGTTGHSEENLQLIQKFQEQIPIFLSSNFSILFHLLLKMTSLTQGLSNCDFIVEDTHHKHKKDCPSGSCKDIIKTLEKNGISPRVTSYRVGEVVGIHTLKIFYGNESLILQHNVSSREVFCEGALKACEFILKKTNSLYSMNDLFEKN